MKIAFLCGSVFDNGGVQRVVTTLSNAFAEKNEVYVICTNNHIKEDYNKYGLKKNVKIIYSDAIDFAKSSVYKLIKGINRYTGLFNLPKLNYFLEAAYYPPEFKKSIIEIANKEEFDIIIGCEGLYSIFLATIKNKINCKVIGWEHSSFDAYFNNKYRYYWNRNSLFQKYLDKLDGHVVLTKSDEKKYKQEFGIKSKAIYNPLSFETDIKSKLIKKNIVAAGRLEPPKGFDILLECFYKFTKKNSEWNLYIAGEGRDYFKLKSIIKKYKIEDRVEIVKNTNDISRFLRSGSIYAMSSRWEGFGLVVTEALEVGLPIISFDVSGPSEIIGENKCGIIVKKGKLDEYTNKLLEVSEDYNLRREMSRSSISRAKDFKVDKILNEWNEYFNAILNKEENDKA